MFEPGLLAMLAWPLFSDRLARLRERCAIHGAVRPCARRHTMELRVDVQWGAAEVEDELKLLHARLQRSGLLEHGTRIIKTPIPDLIFRHREADGEHYIYVEDVARGCLAGYTVFNRLIEVNRRLDRFVRAPHSKYAGAYQRRGIATVVYEWALGQGMCLISGARQSQGANALWRSLATRHRLEYIDIRNKCIHLLGASVDQATQDSLQTRMLLFGDGWDVDRGRSQPSPLPQPFIQEKAPTRGTFPDSMQFAHNVMHIFRA